MSSAPVRAAPAVPFELPTSVAQATTVTTLPADRDDADQITLAPLVRDACRSWAG